jgi:hypothetical protein
MEKVSFKRRWGNESRVSILVNLKGKYRYEKEIQCITIGELTRSSRESLTRRETNYV